MAKYSDLQKKFSELREAKKDAAGEMFREEADKIFEKYSDLLSFSWTQYTDYFNDGEPCTFSVHGDYPDILLEGEDDYINEDYLYGEKSDRLHKVEKITEDIRSLLGSVDEEDFESLFGDHVKVVVNRKGKTEVEDYSHHD